jgi:hypothetical protein
MPTRLATPTRLRHRILRIPVEVLTHQRPRKRRRNLCGNPKPPGWANMLQQNQTPTPANHTPHFAEACERIRHLAEDPSGDCPVERLVLKGERKIRPYFASLSSTC